MIETGTRLCWVLVAVALLAAAVALAPVAPPRQARAACPWVARAARGRGHPPRRP